MLITFIFSAWYAWIAIGKNPSTEAIANAHTAMYSCAKASLLVKPIVINTACIAAM
jgi:hypothetical protein